MQKLCSIGGMEDAKMGVIVYSELSERPVVHRPTTATSWKVLDPHDKDT